MQRNADAFIDVNGDGNADLIVSGKYRFKFNINIFNDVLLITLTVRQKVLLVTLTVRQKVPLTSVYV